MRHTGRPLTTLCPGPPRWFEQMYFELDMIPYTDTQDFSPAGSFNTYRSYYSDQNCTSDDCGLELATWNKPCRYITDLFQGINWLPEDFPGEATSADHRKAAMAGAYYPWDSIDPTSYTGWLRPVHELGHSVHFSVMH
eukprot:gene5752-5685_t